MVKVVSNTLKNKGDWSLRANGDTFDDDDSLSARLTKRLKNSSSSVIGIAGRRGVGKSSLAQRVLDNCGGVESFTLLIHSPTRYDPQEYLATLFQVVCEKVVERVNDDFGKTNSLLERGKAEIRRLNFNHLVSIFLLSCVIIAVAFGIYFLVVNLEQYESFSYAQTMINFTPILLVAVTSVVALILVLLLISRVVMPVSQQIRDAIVSCEKSELRRTALWYSEHLRFQTTFSRSSEVGLSALKINAKSGIGKSLATRPLTLPSLATQFTSFLKEVGEVYSGGPVVICLDELDKIEDSKDLNDLLRGIKGILGESGTHFLLTVSEDALTKFNEQRQMKRGILESAFEDIVLLDRIDLNSTSKVVDPMYCKSDRENLKGEIKTSTELLWLFGNAIPREIKRNALVCFEMDSPPKISPPEVIWNLLIKARLDDMKFWAIHAGGEDWIRHRFLKCLGNSIRVLDSENSAVHCNSKWGSDLVTPWVELFEKIISDGHESSENENSRLDFGGAIIEILLGASALVYVVNDSQRNLSDSSIEIQLNDIFKFLSTSPQLAWGIMKEYLADIDIIKEAYLN